MNFTMLRSILLALVLAMGVTGVSAETWQEGVNYKVLKYPVKTHDPSKIEVVEEFWYGCPHCYHLLPLITPWEKALPDDVDFQLSPAAFNKVWKLHARTFYAMKVLGIQASLHQTLFDALVRDRKRLVDEESLADFFAEHGVDKAKFKSALNSFGVKADLKKAIKRAKLYGIKGVPTLVVNGKYTVSAADAGSQENMLKVVDFLVEKERKAVAGH